MSPGRPRSPRMSCRQSGSRSWRWPRACAGGGRRRGRAIRTRRPDPLIAPRPRQEVLPDHDIGLAPEQLAQLHTHLARSSSENARVGGTRSARRRRFRGRPRRAPGNRTARAARRPARGARPRARARCAASARARREPRGRVGGLVAMAVDMVPQAGGRRRGRGTRKVICALRNLQSSRFTPVTVRLKASREHYTPSGRRRDEAHLGSAPG